MGQHEGEREQKISIMREQGLKGMNAKERRQKGATQEREGG